jgi:hypothetical protein
MTTASLSYAKLNKQIRGKVGSVAMPWINWKIVFLMGLAMMSALLVMYVFQINELTKGSYLVSSYENKINTLSQENKNLQVSFAENSFLGEALKKAEDLNFQKTMAVKYIQVLDKSFASAKNEKF